MIIRSNILKHPIVAPALSIFAICLHLTGCGGSESSLQSVESVESTAKPPRGPQIDFLTRQTIGNPPAADPPWITHLAVVDLDQNGLLDVIFSDALAEKVCWLAQEPAGTYTEHAIGDPIKGPTHLAANDIDGDGDRDILVASMGIVFPTSEEVGAVVVLENDGHQHFTNRYLAEGIPRVTDVEAGDFDGDGDTDLVAGQFGYETGEIRWMENIGDGWTFRDHYLLKRSGTIHTPVVDIDGDGDLDIVALVSQEWEEVYIFANDGKGAFTPKMIYGSTNEDFGSSGITLGDLDGDSDLDILYTNGDSFDYLPPGPRPWHGIQWIENQGGLNFEYHRIDDFAGAASAWGADVDQDGDVDLIATSSLGQDEYSTDASMIWFENDGDMRFTRRDIARDPTNLIVVAPADMNGDGRVDFITGGFHSAPPYGRLSRVTLWLNNGQFGAAGGAR